MPEPRLPEGWTCGWVRPAPHAVTRFAPYLQAAGPHSALVRLYGDELAIGCHGIPTADLRAVLAVLEHRMKEGENGNA